MTPIKTGCWLWRDEYQDGVWCDLYLTPDGNALIARVLSSGLNGRTFERDTCQTLTRDSNSEPIGVWATMHTCPIQFQDGDMTTWISDDFSVFYELQINPKDGGYHSVKLA